MFPTGRNNAAPGVPGNREEAAAFLNQLTEEDRQLLRTSMLEVADYNVNTRKFVLKRKYHEYGPSRVNTVASTGYSMETWTFLWTIKCYSSFIDEMTELASPVFKGGAKSNHSWRLKLTPKRVAGELEYTALYLTLDDFGDGDSSDPNRTIRVRFQLTIVDANGDAGRQTGGLMMKGCDFKKNETWGFNKFILASELNSPLRRLVEDNELNVHCRIWLEGDLEHEIYDGGASRRGPSEPERATKRANLMAAEFGKLFRDPVFSDVQLVTAKRTFPAHKAVLSARSPVFAAIFNNGGPVDNKINKVQVLEFDDDVVEGMLEYMYTSETSLLKKQLAGFLQIAEKYEIAQLKEDCVLTIVDNLSINNAAMALMVAVKYNLACLKEKVIDYIHRNKSAVVKTDSFLKMKKTHPGVFVDLYLSA